MMDSLLHGAIAPSTRRTYSAGIRQFKAFCREEHLPYLPDSELTICKAQTTRIFHATIALRIGHQYATPRERVHGSYRTCTAASSTAASSTTARDKKAAWFDAQYSPAHHGRHLASRRSKQLSNARTRHHCFGPPYTGVLWIPACGGVHLHLQHQHQHQHQPGLVEPACQQHHRYGR